MVIFSDEIKKCFVKIEEKLGVVPRAGKFVYKTTNSVVRKKDDLNFIDMVFDTIANTSLNDVQKMLESIEDEQRAEFAQKIERQYEIPILDGRFERLKLNDHDFKIFRKIRVPFAENKEASASVLCRESGVLLYLHGNEATRIMEDTIELLLPAEEKEYIESEVAKYRKMANDKLLELSASLADKADVHQELTEWLIHNIPTLMLPEYGQLKIRCKKYNKEFIPQDIIGLLNPLGSSKRLEGDERMVIKNLKPLSNDSMELAVKHIDLTNLPDDEETPAWVELSHRYTDDEWDVLKAFIYSIFNMRNTSRQALVIYDQGHSGKSCLFNALQWAIGEQNYCTMEALQDPSKDKFFASHLYGKRLVVVPDCKDPCLLRRGWIHNFTGNDTFSIEFKNRNAFSARCYGKVVVATNTLPQLDTDSNHIKTRLIVLCPKMNEASLEILAQRDKDGNMVRDENGKVLLKGDNRFEQRLKDEFWAFLRQCKEAYDRLAIDDETIREPDSVAANKDIAQDMESQRILDLCDDVFAFDPSYKIHTDRLREAIGMMTQNSLSSEKLDIRRVVQVLAENRGITPCRALKIDGKTKTGYRGLCLLEDSDNVMDRIISELDMGDDWRDLMSIRERATNSGSEIESYDNWKKICDLEEVFKDKLYKKVNDFFTNARQRRDETDPNGLLHAVDRLGYLSAL